MTNADTSSIARTAKIREAARRTFVAALHELDPDQQHSVVSDIMQANNLEAARGPCPTHIQLRTLSAAAINAGVIDTSQANA